MFWIAKSKLVSLVVSVIMASIFVLLIVPLSVFEWLFTRKTGLLNWVTRVVKAYINFLGNG